jgi:type I restriction enzyme S subunit
MGSEENSSFKKTEIGTLPRDWDVKEFSEVLLEKTRNGLYKSKTFHGRGTKMINMGELFAYSRIGDLDMELVELTDSEKDRFLVRNGDLLFARRSLVAAGAGKCSLVFGDYKRTFESSIIRARPDPKKANSEYLFYFFSSNVGKHLLDSILRHVAVAGITGSDLMKLKIALPSLQEQQRIAEILAVLDRKIALDERLNKTLEAIGRAVFRRWFIDFEFPNEEGKPYKSSGGQMVYESYLGKEVPKEWKVGKIEDVADVVGGGTPSTKVESYFADIGIPWLTPKDLSGYAGKFIDRGATDITEKGLKNSSAKLMPKGTILFTSRAPIGYCAIALNEIATNQGFKSLVPKNHMKSEYIYQYITRITPFIQSISGGSTFGEITGSAMKEIRIIIPRYDVLEKFEELMSPINSRITNNIFGVRTLKRIRDSLLPKLMSGKIRVPFPKENIEAQ